jgi:hypothetical protein
MQQTACSESIEMKKCNHVREVKVSAREVKGLAREVKGSTRKMKGPTRKSEGVRGRCPLSARAPQWLSVERAMSARG